MKDIQRIRPLAIFQLLKNYTDSTVALGSFEIANTLNLEGLPTSIKEVKEDVKLLKDWGFGVVEIEGEDRYYVPLRLFTDAELRVLLDAVEASSFITEKKTKELTDKITTLAGVGRAKKNAKKKTSIVLQKSVKHSNENVFNSIEILDACIARSLKCSFLYFDYDLEGRRVYRKERNRYVVNPLALAISEDNYYLLAYGDKYENVASYRVDRMEGVMPESEPIKDAPWLKDFDLNSYRKQAFSMFKGELTEVSLEGDVVAIDGIVDKFSESVNMLRIDDNTFRVKVKVQVSPTFFGWCATSGGRIKIVAPENVKKAYYEHLSKC